MAMKFAAQFSSWDLTSEEGWPMIIMLASIPPLQSAAILASGLSSAGCTRCRPLQLRPPLDGVPCRPDPAALTANIHAPARQFGEFLDTGISADDDGDQFGVKGEYGPKAGKRRAGPRAVSAIGGKLYVGLDD